MLWTEIEVLLMDFRTCRFYADGWDEINPDHDCLDYMECDECPYYYYSEE